MSDLVRDLLFRASDQNGVGWTPTTVVPVPAGLLHRAADEIERLRAALEAWNSAVRIDVLMEGPCYMGVSRAAGARAWELTRAVLAEEKPNE